MSIPANDWNEHPLAESWRASWAEQCNKYLERDHHIDHRSYVRQGIDLEPEIHEGAIARQMEKEGKTAIRCEMNREIRERNSIRKQLMEVAAELTKMITEKTRTWYGRVRELRRDSLDTGSAGAEAGYPGGSAERRYRRSVDQRETQEKKQRS